MYHSKLGCNRCFQLFLAASLQWIWNPLRFTEQYSSGCCVDSSSYLLEYWKTLHLRTENYCNNQSRYSPVHFYLLILMVNSLACFSLEVILVSWWQMERFDCNKFIWLSPVSGLVGSGKGRIWGGICHLPHSGIWAMGTLSVTGRLRGQDRLGPPSARPQSWVVWEALGFFFFWGLTIS